MVHELSKETLWVRCPTCGFELTLVLKPADAERLFKITKGSTVPCWGCGLRADIIRNGGTA